MGKDIIDISNYSQIQKDTIKALLQSCEKKSVNLDKFITWVSKNYSQGSSIIMHILNSLEKGIF